MNHYIKDFTEKNYEKILILAEKRYEFITYDKVENYNEAKEFLLWRHDVDFSVHRALALARIENNLDIRSTYFLMLGSMFYNIFEEEIRKLIKDIISLGHKIALHFDPTLYDIKNTDDLEKYLKFEKDILENLFNIEINVFSFHNPTEEILRNDNFKYAGMINTYAKYFKENVMYCSDSNGYWRFERLENFLTKETKGNRQVLTHPAWWQKEAISPYERIKRSVYGRYYNVLQNYEEGLRKHGRKNFK